MTDKPATLSLLMDGVPSALRALPWIGWRWVLTDEGEWKKKPYQLGHPERHAANDAITHWRNEGDVREVQIFAPSLFDGFGVVLTEAAGLTFVDLDDVRDPDSGVIASWALQMLNKFDSWAEVSVSGTGLHIFASGVLPGAGFNAYLDGNPAHRVEAYSRGRFAYLTGHALEPVRPVAERRRLITLLAQHVGPAATSAGATTTAGRDDAPIPAGQRNDALFRIARGLVLYGLRGADLERALIAVARRRCVPVPPDRDVVKIARHAERLPDRRLA